MKMGKAACSAALVLAGALAACGQGGAAQGSVPSLSGTEWVLVSAESAEAVEGATIAFGTDGTVSGSTGCNRFNGRYNTLDGVLRIGPVAATRRACNGVSGATEAAFLVALDATRGAEMEAGVLVWTDAEARPIARLEPI